jgi:lysophospholipase L1-like esterase
LGHRALNALLPRAVFWLLLPVMAVQGLWLRRQATRLPGAVGERRGVVGDGAALHLLALGDSIIDGVGTGYVAASLPVQFAEAVAERLECRVHWRVEGGSGHDAEAVIVRLDSLEAGAPADVVLLSVGVNDVTGLSSTRHWRHSLQRLLGSIRGRWPDALVLFAGLPPMAQFPLPPEPLSFALGLRAATLDGIARAVVAHDRRALHIPTRIDPALHEFSADGFHPSANSCTLWAKALAEALTEKLAGEVAGESPAVDTRRTAQ